MLQASFKCETPRLELKSSRTFLAIKRCQRTKIQKVIKLAQSSNKKWLQIRAIAVKLFKMAAKSLSELKIFPGKELTTTTITLVQ